MKERATQVRYIGTVTHHHEAEALIRNPGDAVLVYRGCDRSVVMGCPDGCGEILTINLDERAGKAWEKYGSETKFSLFPSVWRSTGCESHFVVWRGHIDWLTSEWWEPSEDLKQSVYELLLTKTPRIFRDLAKELNEIPWDVAAACRALVRDGKAREGTGAKRGWFSRIA